MGDFVPQWYVWIIGIILPPIERLIIKKNFPSFVKVLIALGTSILVGLGATYLGGKFDLTNIMITVGVIFTIAQTTYDSFWKNNLPSDDEL